MQQSEPVVVYCDGACSGNPGPGAWAAILSHGGREREISGYDPATTNNRMELQAAIEALALLRRPCQVRIYTDSQYVCRGAREWLRGWMARGWRSASGQPVANRELWEALAAQLARHAVEWHWVRGHSGDPMNERADGLARACLEAGRMSPAPGAEA